MEECPRKMVTIEPVGPDDPRVTDQRQSASNYSWRLHRSVLLERIIAVALVVGLILGVLLAFDVENLGFVTAVAIFTVLFDWKDSLLTRTRIRDGILESTGFPRRRRQLLPVSDIVSAQIVTNWVRARRIVLNTTSGRDRQLGAPRDGIRARDPRILATLSTVQSLISKNDPSG